MTRLKNGKFVFIQIIIYQIGNPTSYLGAALSWRGRELVKYEKGNKQISYSYDVDGMRYRKVVKTNGVETARYDYVYSEGRLILLTYTSNGASNTARFIYDSLGEIRGFILDNTQAYLYLKNGQGDITGIVDESGSIILTYSYTAWGKVTYSATDMEGMALAATLSNVNPFTYRGYCYDYDIGMYYLQSRYYDPNICRFINADSTDYLGATGTTLSYNLFAYCENDGINYLDATGTWGKDVHQGYYSIKIKTKDITTYRYEGFYIPYISDKGYYGTFYWARSVGFSREDSKTIAKECYAVDSEYNPWLPVGDFAYNQSFHFNTNAGKNSVDSRLVISLEMMCKAIVHLEKMKKFQKSNKIGAAYDEKVIALKYIGYALHPLQDYYAHRDEYVDFMKKEAFIKVASKSILNVKININFKIFNSTIYPKYNGIKGAWHHLDHPEADRVLDNESYMWKAGKYTLRVLKEVYTEYFK